MRERELDRLRARFLRGRPRARCVHLRGRRFARRRAARLARHEHRAGPENEGGGDADAERDEQRGEKIDDDRTYPRPARSFHLRSPCAVPASGRARREKWKAAEELWREDGNAPGGRPSAEGMRYIQRGFISPPFQGGVARSAGVVLARPPR